MPAAPSTRAPLPPRTGSRTDTTSPTLLHEDRQLLVLGVIAAIGAVVIGLWWVNTPAGSLRTFSDRLTAAGRITGLLGTYLALVEVVLMARLPWLDRAIGTDNLTRWHRQNGQYTISLLVAHAVLTVWGYARADHVTVASELRTVVLHYPDMLAATVGLALFIAVSVTSVRAARQRLHYETWYFVHLYVYLALALSFAHQLATGNDFVTHPVSRAVWVLLYVAAGAMIVGYRLGMPIRSAVRHRLRVYGLVREGPNHVSVWVTGRHLNELAADAGQHFRWRFLTRDHWWESHPYSLSALPDGRYLRITVKESGDHTRGLQRLRPGTRVIAEGPYGGFTALRRRHHRVLLIAGGIGITPLRALFEELPARPGDLTLLYRAGRDEDVVLSAEIEKIARYKGANVRYVVGPRTMRPDPFAPRSLTKLVPDLVHHDVFVCGPPGMNEAAIAGLRAAGVPRSQIHTENFAF